jgi:hypothetical protein
MGILNEKRCKICPILNLQGCKVITAGLGNGWIPINKLRKYIKIIQCKYTKDTKSLAYLSDYNSSIYIYANKQRQ